MTKKLQITLKKYSYPHGVYRSKVALLYMATAMSKYFPITLFVNQEFAFYL